MAFDRFLSRERVASPRRHGGGLVVALVVHVFIVGAVIVHSFWRVEEVTPPRLAVVLGVLPAPAPPPPPSHGAAKPAAARVKEIERRERVAEIVQPVEVSPVRDEPVPMPVPEHHEPEADEPAMSPAGSADGVPGGMEGGVPGGVRAGVPGGAREGAPVGRPPPRAPPSPRTAPVGPKGQRVFSLKMASLQYLENPMPSLPREFRKGRYFHVVRVQICVTAAGFVDSVEVLESAAPAIDQAVTERVSSWSYRPATINEKPVPFCYTVRFNFTDEG